MDDYILDTEAEDYNTKLKQIINDSKEINVRVIAGSTAYHQLGDISREWGINLNERPEYVRIDRETEHYYVGAWVEGFGFFNVVYPKNSIRELSQEEQQVYSKLKFTLS